jgi:hypothetical protein
MSILYIHTYKPVYMCRHVTPHVYNFDCMSDSCMINGMIQPLNLSNGHTYLTRTVPVLVAACVHENILQARADR